MVESYAFGETFQRHALSVLCRIPGGVLRYRSALDHTYFGSSGLRVIAETLFAHVDEHKALPQQPTLLEEIKENASDDDLKRIEKTLAGLYRQDLSDAKAVLLKLVDFGKQQAFVNATLDAAEKLDKGDRNLRPLFDKASLVGEDLLDLGVNYRRDAESRFAWYRDPNKQQEDRIRTGIPHLDAMLDGGLSRGELGVVLAPPKRGKTTTLINIAFGALTSVARYNVIHYSLEMDQDKVSRRYDDRLMGARVKFRKSDPDRYARMVEERLGKSIRGNLFVKNYATRTATVSKLRSHLSMLAARNFHPDLIIVDYADIMQAERRMGEMRHEQAGIYEDLRQLAGEFNCVIWTASQTGRGALEKDIVTIEDFAEAFEKAAIVDAAIGFCQSNDERMEHKCRLFGAALRNQEDGRTVECEIRRAECRVRSLALYDVAGEHMIVDGVDDHREDYVETKSGVVARKKKASRKKATKRLKDKVGIAKKKKPGKKFDRKARKSGKKVGKRARRRESKPSNKVRLEDAD